MHLIYCLFIDKASSESHHGKNSTLIPKCHNLLLCLLYCVLGSQHASTSVVLTVAVSATVLVALAVGGAMVLFWCCYKTGK